MTFFFHPEGKSKKEKGVPIQRSTETGMAVELPRNMSRQPSRESNNGSMNSCNSEGKSVNCRPLVFVPFVWCHHDSSLVYAISPWVFLYDLGAALMWVRRLNWDLTKQPLSSAMVFKNVVKVTVPLLVEAHKPSPFEQKPHGSSSQKRTEES